MSETSIEDRNLRAQNLVRETKILTIARLAKMLVDLFGFDEPFKALHKYEGEEVEMYLKGLDGYITFTLTSDRQNFDCRAEKSNDPITRIIINVPENHILRLLSDIIRSKPNLIGLTRIIKYVIPGKLKIKGSYITAIKFSKCLMIGKHDAYRTLM